MLTNVPHKCVYACFSHAAYLKQQPSEAWKQKRKEKRKREEPKTPIHEAGTTKNNENKFKAKKTSRDRRRLRGEDICWLRPAAAA